MPIRYVCGNCGSDHDDLLESELRCIACDAETCSLCREDGKCYDCVDLNRSKETKPVMDPEDFRPARRDPDDYEPDADNDRYDDDDAGYDWDDEEDDRDEY